MKFIYIFLFITVSSFSTQAQSYFWLNSEFTVNGIAYTSENLRVNSRVTEKNSVNMNKKIRNGFFPKTEMYKLCALAGTIFTKERLQELMTAHKHIGIFLITDKNGYILEVSFTIAKISLLTPEEVHALNKIIKEKFKINYPPEADYSNEKYLGTNMICPFSAILEYKD